jgi:hypothetical protein
MRAPLHTELAQAIDQKLPGWVITRWKGKPLQLHVTLRRHGGDGFWVKVVDAPSGFGAEAVSKALRVEVSFVQEGAVVTFDSAVLDRKRGLWSGQMLLLKPPAELAVSERRGNGREAVPDSVGLTAEVEGWKATTPRVWDLSEGGAGLLAPVKLARALDNGQELSVALRWGGEWIRLPARVCGVRELSRATARVGVRFKPADAESAALLSALLKELRGLRVGRALRGQLRGRAA